MTTTQTRIPRPMGLTLLSKEYQENNSDDNQQRLRKHLINQYTLSGFRLNGVPVPIHELSTLVNIPLHEINNLVSESGKNLGAFNSPEQIQNTITSIISLSTNWAIMDKGLINQQIEILAQAQGGTYKPFISGELNKALKTGLDANKNLMEIYRTFFTSNTTNILNIYGNKEEDDQDLVTPQKAFDLINKALPTPTQGSLPNPSDPNALPAEELSVQDRQRINDQAMSQDDLEKLYQEHSLGDLIEVRENRSVKASLQKVSGPLGSSDQGLEGLNVKEPVSLEAPRRKKPNSHEYFNGRRGLEYIDEDDI